MNEADIQIALARYYDVNTYIVIPNCSYGLGLNYEADLLVISKSGYSTEIEIKISKSDLLNDFKKKNFHNCRKNKYFFYAVPEELKDFALENIPDYAGLFCIRKIIYKNEILNKVIVAKKPKIINNVALFTEKDMNNAYRLVYLRFWNLFQKTNKKFIE